MSTRAITTAFAWEVTWRSVISSVNSKLKGGAGDFVGRCPLFWKRSTPHTWKILDPPLMMHCIWIVDFHFLSKGGMIHKWVSYCWCKPQANQASSENNVTLTSFMTVNILDTIYFQLLCLQMTITAKNNDRRLNRRHTSFVSATISSKLNRVKQAW